MLTPADCIAGSSLEKDILPATRIEERSAQTGDVVMSVEGMLNRWYSAISSMFIFMSMCLPSLSIIEMRMNRKRKATDVNKNVLMNWMNM
jgi:hypothetical protein